MASDPTVLALRQFESLTCILPDCGADLAVRWELYAPLTLGELSPDADPLVPGDAYAGDWRVECELGHVILVPVDPAGSRDEAEEALCEADLCDHDHSEELREWRRSDVERLRALLDPRHVIEFRTDGWTIQHPLACRLSGALFDCPVNRAAEGLPGFPPGGPGRYVVSLDGDRLAIGDRIDPPDRP